LAYKDIVFQGTQSRVSLPGREESVGFYNTFVGRLGSTAAPAGVEVVSDPASGDIHMVSGPHFRGVQFHAESILTEHGYELIHDLVLDLLA
jgi:phenazine biosynthesis protein phzE